LNNDKQSPSPPPGRSAADAGAGCRPGRGCVFFNFGDAYALRLLVAISSLRRVYNGPVTTFLATDATGVALRGPLEQLGSDVIMTEDLGRAADRHRVFRESPYDTTLVFDSDLLFLGPIDELWEPIEREGVLLTRFHPLPWGVDGSPERPGWADRVGLMRRIRNLVGEDAFNRAVSRMIDQRIDINAGVMGIARPQGEAFLAEWAEYAEAGRSRNIPILDELLVVALATRHGHYLAGEPWNCPADEFFRRTNLGDARIIHYFADGTRPFGIRLGRNPATWAGRKWYQAYRQAAADLDLGRWKRTDPSYTGRVGRLFAHGPRQAARATLGGARARAKAVRKRAAWHFERKAGFPAQQALLSRLAARGYRVSLDHPARATVIILSYKRPDNIGPIVQSALLCGFVDRVIVSNNNPDIDLRRYLAAHDPRLELRQQQQRLGPSYRYELARQCDADYFICIDDDVFPSPWQLRRLFRSLVEDPAVPRGAFGQVYVPSKNILRKKRLAIRPLRDQTQPVDVILQVHAFTRRHLAAYFSLLERLGIANADVHSSEDVIISFTGTGRPVLQDVGHLFMCPTRRAPGIATHRRDGFDDYRMDLYHRAAGVP